MSIQGGGEGPAVPENPHLRTRHHFAAAAKFSPREIRRDLRHVSGFNARLALIITRGVGSMVCAYSFCLIALVSLPAILIEADVLTKSSVPAFFTKPGLILIVAWVAQTLIQLVLLSIIMVGQDVAAKASDARAEHTFQDAEVLLDKLDENTAGGIRTILDRLDRLEATRPVIRVRAKPVAKPKEKP